MNRRGGVCPPEHTEQTHSLGQADPAPTEGENKESASSAQSAPKKLVGENKESASSASSASENLEEEDTMQAMGYRSSEVQECRSSDNSFDYEKQKESASSASEKLVSDELQATSDEMQAAHSSALLKSRQNQFY